MEFLSIFGQIIITLLKLQTINHIFILVYKVRGKAVDGLINFVESCFMPIGEVEEHHPQAVFFVCFKILTDNSFDISLM